MSPQTASIISKNDGSFDAKVAVSAIDHNEPDATQTVLSTDTFLSTDGSVEFTVCLDNVVTAADMPILEVVPHFITSEEARHVASILFGNVDFYVAEPRRSENYSKSEIQEKINRWTEYISEQKIKELYGYIPSNDVPSIINSYIERYTQLYEVAPETNPHILSQWEFGKASEFLIPKDDLKNVDLSADNDEICVQTHINGVPFLFSVSNRNKSDFKVNLISAYISPGLSPNNIDRDIFRAQLCRTSAPTAEQIESIQAEACRMLGEMNLGEWEIDAVDVEVEYYGEIPEYILRVTAVPVLGGVKAIRQPQLTNLRKENQYASNYYLTDVVFEFSASGELVSFEMYSPLDIKSTINSNVQVMDFDLLLERATDILRHSDYYEYGFGRFIHLADEELLCTVNISELAYNLIRVKVQNSDEAYYYVPGISLHGTASYTGKTSGKLYYESETLENILVLNAVDGTIISIGED